MTRGPLRATLEGGMWVRSAIALSAAAVLVAGAAPVRAQGAWSAPQTLSSGFPAGTPTLAFDAHGAALATWAERAGGRWSASRASSARTFASQRRAPDIGEETVEGTPPAPVVDGAGGVVALEQRRLGAACGVATRFALVPRFGRVDGAFAPGRMTWTVFSHTEPPAATLAGNARGLTVAAWLGVERDARGRCVRPVSEFVRVAVRRPGHGFGAPLTLAHHVSDGPIASAVDARGDVVVAWRAGTSIEVRTRSPRGAWGAVRRVAAGVAASLAIASAPDGTTYLLWTGRAANAPHDAREASAAVLAPGSARIIRATLDSGVWPNGLYDLPAHFAIRLALAPRGAIAAWTSWDGAHLRARTAVLSRSAIGSAHEATPAGQDWAVGDLAVAPSGHLALALTSGASEQRVGPFVAVGSAAGVFVAPEPIGDGSTLVSGEAIGADPRTGRPTLVWIEAHPGAITTTATLAATRSGAL